MLHTPLWMQDQDYPAQLDRQILEAGLGTGVVVATDLAVTQRGAGANMTVDVAPGRVVIPGPTGRYLAWSDSVVNLAIAAAPGVGDSRIDVVYAEARDANAMGGSDNDWQLAVATGTPSASPTVPSIPAYAVALARVTLSSSTTSITNSIITDVRAQSVSPALARWPRSGYSSLPDRDIGTSADNWGSPVTFTAPHRPCRLLAWVDGMFTVTAGSGSSGDLAIQVGWSGGPSTSKSARTSATSAITPSAISKVYAVDLTPAAGTDVTVQARIIASSADGRFERGELVAQLLAR
jgi:hypothetical protein